MHRGREGGRRRIGPNVRTLALDDNPGHTVKHLFFGSGVRRGPAPGGLGVRRDTIHHRLGTPARRGGVERLRTVALVAVTAALVLAGASGAVASPGPTPTPTPAEPTLVLAPLAHGVVAAGGALTATIEVSNPTDTALEPTSLAVELSDSPLTSSAELDEWIDDGELVAETSVIDRPAVPSVIAGDSEIVVSTVAVEALAGRGPGVYALSATYGGDLVSRSAIVLQGETPITAAIGVIVAVAAGPQTDGLLTGEELTTLTGTDGRLTDILSAVAGTSAILAIDPALLASIRVLGDSAPPSALAWLDRLGALPNERFALQFGDADVSVQADAGLTTLLEPTSLDYAMSADDFADVTATPAPDPTATPDADAEDGAGTDTVTLPDLDELLAVPGARATLYWPAHGRADADAVSGLAQQPSASGSPATTLLSSAATQRAEARAAASTAEGAPLLVYEAGTSSAVRATAGAKEGSTQAASALISAQIAIEASSPSGPLVVTTERMAELGTTSLRAAIDTVFSYPGVVPATLSALLSAEPAGAQVTAQADEVAAARLDTLLAGESMIADFSSIIDDPSLLTAPARSALLQLIGAGWRDDPEAWQAALAAHAEVTTTTLTSVAIQEPSTVQLVSPEAVLPFFIRNDLPFVANVVLVSTPDNLRLDVERTLTVRAEPGVNTRVEVPVRARVGSGEVTIELRLLSPTFEQVGPVQRAQVTVRAEWERIGIIGLGAIIVLLLGAGFIRTIRRRRRTRAAEKAADATDE
jgi:hypothetical protein